MPLTHPSHTACLTHPSYTHTSFRDFRHSLLDGAFLGSIYYSIAIAIFGALVLLSVRLAKRSETLRKVYKPAKTTFEIQVEEYQKFMDEKAAAVKRKLLSRQLASEIHVSP